MASLHLPEAGLTRADLQYCGPTMVQAPQNPMPQDLDFGKNIFMLFMNLFHTFRYFRVHFSIDNPQTGWCYSKF